MKAIIYNIDRNVRSVTFVETAKNSNANNDNFWSFSESIVMEY